MYKCLVHSKHLKVLVSLVLLVCTCWGPCCKCMRFRKTERGKYVFSAYCTGTNFKPIGTSGYGRVPLESKNHAPSSFKTVPTLLHTTVPCRH